jgi:hypothetical protein
MKKLLSEGVVEQVEWLTSTPRNPAQFAGTMRTRSCRLIAVSSYMPVRRVLGR